MKEIVEMIKNQTESIKGMSDRVDERLNAFDVRMAELEKVSKPRKVELAGLEDEKQSFSFLRAINAIRSGNWGGAGFEKEIFDNTRMRAMSAGTDSAGGYIVPTVFVNELIEMLRAESVVNALGATVLSGLTGSPVEIPKQTGGATAYWVAENADITASDLTLGQVSLTPKAVAAIVKLSNRLLNLSNPSAEAMVRRDVAQSLALAIDLAALRGTGSGSQPTGIANTSGINTVAIGTNGGNFTFDYAADMVDELAKDNAAKGKLGFAMHPTIAKKLKKTRIPQYSGDTGGEWIMLPMSDSNLADALGYGFKLTTQIPVNLTKGSSSDCSEVYFGNWQELLIGEWGGLEIMASNETSDAFQKNQTWVRVIQEVDIAVRHAESFCLLNDARIA